MSEVELGFTLFLGIILAGVGIAALKEIFQRRGR